MTISKAMMTVTISLLMLLMMTMGNAGDGADDYDNDDGGHEAHLGIIRCSRITEFACCSAAQGLKPTAITVSSLANTNRRRGQVVESHVAWSEEVRFMVSDSTAPQ